jgi:hypothetical protein
MKSIYIVYHDEYGDEGVSFSAFDHEDAAEQFAEHHDSDGDYPIVGGDSPVVVVGSDGVTKMMRLSGETVPSYSAREVKK